MMKKYPGQALYIDAIEGFSADGWHAQNGCLTSIFSNFFNQLANQSQYEQALLAKLAMTDELAYSIGQNLSPVQTELNGSVDYGASMACRIGGVRISGVCKKSR